MDFTALLEKFLASSHGQNAAAALSDQGISGDDAQTILAHSISAGAAHVEQAHTDGGGLFGAHSGTSFLAAFAFGMIRGNGVLGSLEVGAVGVIQGRIVELLTSQMGMSSTAAAAAAGATAPYVLSFLREHLGA